MIPPVFLTINSESVDTIVNGLILAALTALNIAVALGLGGYRADPPQFFFALGTGSLLAFFEYLAIRRGLAPREKTE